MFFHLFLTTRCNLSCRYCYGSAMEDKPFPFSADLCLPEEFTDFEGLKSFLERDPDPTLIFYGGEPLLALEGMLWLMDHVKARFILQTNGLLLNHLPPEYLSRLHTILLSIDGREETTDFFRGKGTFRRVLENLRRLDFGGELVARMTVMEPVDIFEEVTWLLTNEDFPFRSVHWQLNAGFWADADRRNFADWVEGYNLGVRRLAEWWVRQMEGGKVLRIYPLLGVARSLLLHERCWMRCGAGHSNYAIQTDGRIVPCPAMWGMRSYYLGSIESSDPLNLPKIFPSGPCAQCELLEVCGGRCLYAAITQKWGASYKLVCQSVRNLLESLLQLLPRIRRVLEEGRVKMEDFDYLEFNGCEIIP
ncbi:MAG: TIGR04084 family radical SAM/SPASM domain-containing protein [Candidatus Hadarchaeales archaeon]